MRYRFKQRRTGRIKRVVIRLAIVLPALVICLTAVFLFIDHMMTKRVAAQYGAALTADVQYRDVAGANLAFRHFGSEGPVILMVHGFLGSSNDYAAIWPELAETHQVIAVDLIGFGLSDKSIKLDYSKRNMARLCSLLMAELGFARYTVLGHSMGGEVALHMADLFPDIVEQLILLNSAGTQDIQQGLRPVLPAWFIEGVFKNYLVQRLSFPIAVRERGITDGDTFNRFYFFNSQIPAETLLKMTRDNDSGSLAKRLPTISMPVLLIWGAQDRIIPLEQGQTLDSLLPDSRLSVIEGCGHLSFLEKPTETLVEIIRFLDDNAP